MLDQNAAVSPSNVFLSGNSMAFQPGHNNIVNVSTTPERFSIPSSTELNPDASNEISPIGVIGTRRGILERIDVGTTAARKFLFSQGKNPEELENKFNHGHPAARIALNNKAVLLAELYNSVSNEQEKENICRIAKDLCRFIAKYELDSRSAFFVWSPGNHRSEMDKISQRIKDVYGPTSGDSLFSKMLDNVFRRGFTSETGTDVVRDSDISPTTWEEYKNLRDGMICNLKNYNQPGMPREFCMVTAWKLIQLNASSGFIGINTGSNGESELPIETVNNSSDLVFGSTSSTPLESSVNLGESIVADDVSQMNSTNKKKQSVRNHQVDIENVAISDLSYEDGVDNTASGSSKVVSFEASSLLNVLDEIIFQHLRLMESRELSPTSLSGNSVELVLTDNGNGTFEPSSLSSSDITVNQEPPIALRRSAIGDSAERAPGILSLPSIIADGQPRMTGELGEETSVNLRPKPDISNDMSRSDNRLRQVIPDTESRKDVTKSAVTMAEAEPRESKRPEQSSSISPVSIATGSVFFKGVHPWPGVGRDLASKDNEETSAVNVRKLIDKLEDEIRFYRPKEDGRVSFDVISPKALSPVHLSERSALGRFSAKHDKKVEFDVQSRAQRNGWWSPDSDKSPGFPEDVSDDSSDQKTPRKGAGRAIHPYARISSTERPVLVSRSSYSEKDSSSDESL